MRETPRLFVSFSSRDYPFVRRLFASLRRQPLELWDYSLEGQEIPGGRRIVDYLQNRVANCDCFVPVVTPNSMKSHYVAAEVACALELGSRAELVLVPLVSQECCPEKDWLAPYAGLAPYRFYRFDFALPTWLEQTVARLCRDLGIAYCRPPMDDPHLPFLDRLNRELDRRCPRRSERTISIYCRLEELRDDLVAALQAGDFELAIARAEFFTSTCEYEFPDQKFYYPYVAKAVCLLLSGRQMQAIDVLRELLGHPDVDENTYAALGYVRECQGAYAEALAYYAEAARADPRDPTARRGVILNSLLVGQTDGLQRCLAELESLCRTAFDRHRTKELKAYALVCAGAIQEGLATYDELVREGSMEARIVINYSQALWEAGNPLQALALLRRFKTTFLQDAEFLHHLALRAFQCREEKEAGACFVELLRRQPPKRNWLIDAAQAYWCMGNHALARQVATRALTDETLPMPSTREDFYCDGFANYILGRHDRADYDFGRSRHPAEDHYSQILT